MTGFKVNTVISRKLLINQKLIKRPIIFHSSFNWQHPASIPWTQAGAGDPIASGAKLAVTYEWTYEYEVLKLIFPENQ